MSQMSPGWPVLSYTSTDNTYIHFSAFNKGSESECLKTSLKAEGLENLVYSCHQQPHHGQLTSIPSSLPHVSGTDVV